MTNGWLVNHAVNNVWCQPSIDARYLVRPARLSPPEGEVYGMVVSEHSIRLPKEETWYHVFQIGNFDLSHIGVTQPWRGWAKLDVLCNTYNTHIMLYNIHGRTLPLSLAYMRVLENNNVIIALERYDLQADFSKEDLYVRFYDGKFKYSADYLDAYKSFTQSGIMRNGEQIFNFVVEYQKAKAMAGYTYAWINGYAVTNLTIDNIKIWDYVEFFHDGLVKEVVTFNVKTLPTFTSVLDQKRKYILHPPKKTATIDFNNDVEIYLFDGADGRYYTTHRSESLRQLTHRDFVIPTADVQRYTAYEPDWVGVDNLKLQLTIRRSGLDRPLIFEEHRIHELYKLSDSQILAAMTGMDSLLAEWQAANLEQSDYLKIMAARYSNITNALCTSGYGYNSISTLVAATPQRTTIDNGQTLVQLPPLLAQNCTVYEYDAVGYLLGYYDNTGSPTDVYYCKHANCVTVEAIEGQGSRTLDINWNAALYQVEEGLNYRFYHDTLLSGVETYNYTDITDSDDYAIDDNGVVTWSLDQTRRRPIVWSDKRFLAYSFTEAATDGILKFSVSHHRADLNTDLPLKFQPEKLELWLNGRPLIQDLDYFVQWPQVVVCCKSYLTIANNQVVNPTITVRARNVSDELIVPKYGFVVNGLLSNNRLFDVRDDKVVRIVVDGKLQTRADLSFREDLSIAVNNGLNGKPYLIDDATIPLRQVITGDTYTLRDKARDIDTRVEAYMTVRYPTPLVAAENVITNKHQLYSPLLQKLINDLLKGLLLPVEDDDRNYISTQQFDTLMANYEYLVDFDPVTQGVDTKYVEIHPHNTYEVLELTPIQYAMVERANFRYLRNQVVLNKLLRVKV